MEMSKFLISDYFTKNANLDIEQIRKKLFEINILSKDYVDDDLLLIYNKFENKNKTPLESECRSIILDRKTFDIVCYTCNTPILNFEAINYMMKKSKFPKEIYKCYEGSLLSAFNYNNKWYLSSRRCLDSKESVINEKSHFDMFEEIIKNDEFEDYNDFTKKLNKDYCYYFVLIHHQNEHNVDYETEFGDNYKKLCLAFVRNKNQKELNLSELELDFVSDNIFLPIKLDNLVTFDEENKNTNILDKPKNEGVIVKINNKYLKLQNINFQFYKAIGPKKNIYSGFINLYQNNKLLECFKTNVNFQNYKKIVNPLNTNESYDTVGIVDAVFKVLTSELFELYKLFWDNDGGHKNKELYEILPKEYKNILFHVRGIYMKKDFIRLGDIYNYLKTISSNDIENLIRIRKLMINWTKLNTKNENLNKFSGVSSKCDRVHYKLIAIYTNKLFPEIMPDDIPMNS
jgi:hypothetical protein